MTPVPPDGYRSWRWSNRDGDVVGSYSLDDPGLTDAPTRPIRIPSPQIPHQRPHPHPGTPISTHFTNFEPDGPTIQYNVQASPEALGLVYRKQVSRHSRRAAAKWIPGGVATPTGAQPYSPVRQSPGQRTRGALSIAVLSLKGGVGKTTTTACLGATLAMSRGDRVIAVDANPDFGTLAQRGQNSTGSTVRDLLSDGGIHRYSDVSRHTSKSTSRLEILGSERDPAASEAFTESDYRAVHQILDRYYDVIITDCGTGLTHSAMTGVLGTADTLVIAASPAVDSARSALATLDWLQHHGYAHLVPHATLALSAARPGAAPLDIRRLTAYFKSRIGSVFVIPYDDHLAEGSEIVLDLLKPKTRQVFTDLATTVSNRFTRNRQITPLG